MHAPANLMQAHLPWSITALAKFLIVNMMWALGGEWVRCGQGGRKEGGRGERREGQREGVRGGWG